MRVTYMRSRAGTTEGYVEPESGTLSSYTFQTNRAAHQLDQALRDTETETCAAVFATDRAVGLHEGLKERRALFLGNADSGVRHGKPDDQISFGLERGADDDPSSFREFYRVAGAFDQDWFHPLRISVQFCRNLRRYKRHQ